MEPMLCLRGDRDQVARLKEVAELGAGIELGSYGLVGIQSPREWERRRCAHRDIVADFMGKVALHGPFQGIEYAYRDHLLKQAVQQRLDMTFDAAAGLKAFRVVLHGGFTVEIELFGLQDDWYRRNVEFWKAEMSRWERVSVSIVLENVIEKSPDPLVRLVDAVDSPMLGLCLDVGHAHRFSSVPLSEWVASMGRRLQHLHLHDNDRQEDRHWPMGKGSLDVDTLFSAVRQHAPDATVSIEVEDTMDVRMDELRKLRRLIGRVS